MFLLKSLGNIVFGKTDGSLIEMPSGKLFYLDPSSPKESRKPVFRDSMLSVRKTSLSHNYQLVVTRISDEWEEELLNELEDDQFKDDEHSFLIDPVLLFRTVKDSSFIWADTADQTGTCGWEFVCQSSNQVTIKLFEEVLFTCMFERSLGKSKDAATDAELNAFVVEQQCRAAASSIGVWRPSKPETPVVVRPLPALNTVTVTDAGEPLVTVEAQLYVYDFRVSQFILMRNAVTVQITQTDAFQFHLLVSEGSTQYIFQPIDSRLNPSFNASHLSFVWVTVDELVPTNSYSWSVKFDADHSDAFYAFERVFGASMYETMNASRFKDVAAVDQNIMIKAYQEDDPMVISESEEEEDEEEEEEEENGSTGVTFSGNKAGDSSKNSHLAVGYKHDRSFVVRGNRIGVFKHTEDDGLQWATTINNVGSLEGTPFSPAKVMLHEQDTSLLLMNPKDKHSIYKMDLEYGKVTEEWKVDDILPVKEILPETKYAQLTPAKTIVGINSNSVFRIDPRLTGNKLVQSESKSYASKNAFSVASTTGNGELAIASEKGEIRLFDRIGIRAKTLFPGLGDAIIGIDSTENGRYLLATCATYLMLLDTVSKETGASGYKKSMGSHKSVPKRLQLKPEHVVWMGSKISFTPARFNTGDELEKSIVTSTGPFVISWNLRRVKAGHLFDYTIKKYADDVVSDNFKYGEDQAIIVAMPDNVEMISKRQLCTPTKFLKSNSSIVNSPY